jgi:hypothetical protein
MLMELEQLAADKELSQIEEELAITDKENFEHREFPTQEEYLQEHESDNFDTEDEEMDAYMLLDLEQHQELEVDITESEESDSMSDDEGLLELVEEDESDFENDGQCLVEESGSESASSASDSKSDSGSDSKSDSGSDSKSDNGAT